MLSRVTFLSGLKPDIPASDIKGVIEHIASLGCRVSLDPAYHDVFPDGSDMVFKSSDDTLFDDSDMIVVMGGDGSIIEAARRSLKYDIPILGINFGRIGYLAEIEAGETALLDKIISGDFRTEERMMLDVEIERDGDLIRMMYPCLNETVLSNAPISRVASFDLYCGGDHAVHCFADGMIVSTPTGSSAYSMSAGGPLIYPTMECILATPICPHSFTLRPIVFTGDSVIEIRNASCRMNKMFVTIDGRDNEEIYTSDTIRIKKSASTTKLVRVKDGGFINTLHTKLGKNNI